jgi:hypothetical protein
MPIDQLEGIADPLPFDPIAGIRELSGEARRIHQAQMPVKMSFLQVFP